MLGTNLYKNDLELSIASILDLKDKYQRQGSIGVAVG